MMAVCEAPPGYSTNSRDCNDILASVHPGRADPCDGKLDLVMLGNLGRWESLTRVVPKLGDGSYLSQPKISRRHATRITIGSDRQVRADVDGESIGQLPLSITLLPFRMNLAVNRPVRA